MWMASMGCAGGGVEGAIGLGGRSVRGWEGNLVRESLVRLLRGAREGGKWGGVESNRQHARGREVDGPPGMRAGAVRGALVGSRTVLA
jgi:hypothetical protein